MASNDSVASIFEKQEGGYTYIYNDIEFNIMENLDSNSIEWQLGSLAYSITGPLRSEEIESIIHSIEKVIL